MDNTDWLRSEISAWEERRNKQQVKIHWSFSLPYTFTTYFEINT
jgi:hypothetical protein